jgi:CheY-like chemotaxis protein
MILFIDDNAKRVQTDVDELKKRGLNVVLVNSADAAVTYLQDPTTSIEAVVCDIMMPPGAFGGDLTRDGLRSGLSIVHSIREISATLPVVVFTNVAREDLGSSLLFGKHSLYLHKPDYLPRNFADRVVRFLQEERKGPGQ